MVRDFGRDPSLILAEVGWSPTLLDDPDNIVPFTSLGRLIEKAAALTECAHFGLLVGEKAGPSAIGALGFATRHAKDVRSALMLLSQGLAHHDRGGVATFVEQGAVANLGYRVLDRTVPAGSHITVASLAIGYQLLKLLCGSSWQPLETRIAIRRPADVNPYRKLFGDLVYFDAGESVISFARQWLDCKVVGADPELQRVLLRAIGDTNLSKERNLGDEVRGVLAGMIGRGEVNQLAVAAHFGLSTRSLHRRLAALGTNFHELLDELRCEVACGLLENTSLPVKQVALMLGYSEVSAFGRSFKRRLACGPSAWRTSRSAQRSAHDA